MGYYRSLVTGVNKENIMSVKLELKMTQNDRDKIICEAYWLYDDKGGFIKHVKALCQKYEISSHILFETIAQCYACLDDVCCEYCGSACPIEVPADIPYMRAKESWFCAVCENAM